MGLRGSSRLLAPSRPSTGSYFTLRFIKLSSFSIQFGFLEVERRFVMAQLNIIMPVTRIWTALLPTSTPAIFEMVASRKQAAQCVQRPVRMPQWVNHRVVLPRRRLAVQDFTCKRQNRFYALFGTSSCPRAHMDEK